MLIIAIEGGDQAGKETQARMLEQALSQWRHVSGPSYLVARGGFPNYRTTIGKLIDDALHGREKISDLAMTYLFEANKAEGQEFIAQLEAHGCDVLILDRYLLSNKVYRQVMGFDPCWIDALQTPLAKPHLTFVLDIDPVTSRRRKGPDTLDLYERNLPLLSRVRETYRYYADGQSIIEINADRSPQEIHEDIVDYLLGFIAQSSAIATS